MVTLPNVSHKARFATCVCVLSPALKPQRAHSELDEARLAFSTPSPWTVLKCSFIPPFKHQGQFPRSPVIHRHCMIKLGLHMKCAFLPSILLAAAGYTTKLMRLKPPTFPPQRVFRKDCRFSSLRSVRNCHMDM